MRLKTGIFDLGRTVISYDWNRALEVFASYGADPERIRGTLIHNDTYEGLEGELYRGGFTPHEYYRASIALLQRTAREQDRASRIHEITEERFWEIINSIFMPNPPMEKLIPCLKRRGYRLIFLTNTCKPHFEFIKKAFRIVDYFDDVVASHQVKMTKPNPRIWRPTLRKTKASPRECFFVDDLPWNLDYPASIGVRTFLYDLDRHGLLLEWLSEEGIL